MRNVTNYRIRRLSEQGRKAANARWQREKEQSDRIAALDPIRVGSKIVRRVIVIENESVIRERTFYEFDRPCDKRRKLRELLQLK